MNTFQIISKKILNLDEFMNNNSNIIKKDENDCFYNKLVFYIFIQKIYSIPNKYLFLEETLKNIFINDKIKCDFINIFSIIQKTYWGFSKLGFLYKYKKAKIIIEYDLCLNPIRENEKNIFCLLQNKNKYLFNIHDLIKIIHNSIANTSYFFNNPLPIKNPYNNVLINKSSLYNIYFYIRMKTLVNPELFFNFYKTNFNINEFTENYQFIIREYAISNYLINSSNEKLCEDIKQLIKNFNITSINMVNKINIDNDFPRDMLIKIMKPYLKLYFLSEYTLLNAASKLKYKKKLYKKLIELNKFNPFFGRKILKFTKIINTSNSQYKMTMTFNSDHPDFNDKKKDKNNFMESHNFKYTDENDDLNNNIEIDRETDRETDRENDRENDDRESETDSDGNLTIISNSNYNFLEINNNLYLINSSQTDEYRNNDENENENDSLS
jgi:hypothetical protein